MPVTSEQIDIDRIITGLKIVDWKKNPDVKKDMRNEIEDYLLELNTTTGLALSFDEIDHILEQALQIARSCD